MRKFFKIFFFLFTLLFILGLIYFKDIRFEFWIWNLSSDNIQKREYYADKIINSGNENIERLINQLDHKYIYETDYIIYCLEEITNHKGKYSNTDSAIKYWKIWYKSEGKGGSVTD